MPRPPVQLEPSDEETRRLLCREMIEALDELKRTARATDRRVELIYERIEQLREAAANGGIRHSLGTLEAGLDLPKLIRSNENAWAEVTARVRRVEARLLLAEGVHPQQIAEFFGVSRQRVAQLLND